MSSPNKKYIKTISKHYDIKKINTKEERNNKIIINIIKFNNFIKTILIKEYSNESVLDFGSGKGGDLFKFQKNGYKIYMGLDISKESIKEAKNRSFNSFKEFSSINFKVQDCFNESFDLKMKYEVISCQFALHYGFLNQITVNNMISNICLHANNYVILTIPDMSCIERRRKREGNKFGNKYYNIEFKEREIIKIDNRKILPCGCNNEKIKDEELNYGLGYNFTLIESINECKEFLIEENNFIKKMALHKFTVKKDENFIYFFNLNYNSNKILYNKMVNNILKEEELDVIRLYKILVFQRN